MGAIRLMHFITFSSRFYVKSINYKWQRTQPDLQIVALESLSIVSQEKKVELRDAESRFILDEVFVNSNLIFM